MKHVLLVLAGATLYLSLSGFQCASSQMNTAQLAINDKDYDKAVAVLTEEVALRPDNAKAWYLLGVARYEQQEYKPMKDAFAKALTHAGSETGKITGQEILDIQAKTYNAWGSLWRSSRQLIYTSEEYDKALTTLDAAEYVMPGMPVVRDMKANAYLGKKDREEANSYYEDYVKLVKEDVEKGVKKGLYIGMERKKVLSKLGSPDVPFDPSRYRYADQYNTSGLTIYYSDGESAEKPLKVKGWKYYNYSKSGVFPYVDYWLSGYPFFNIALKDYSQKNYDDALEILQLTEKFDPGLEEVSSLMSNVYLATNRMEEAKALLVRKIREEPENTKNRITYSVLLHDDENYSEAIKVLNEALKYENDKSSQEYQDVVFNLGAYSKNWGVQLESEAAKSSNVTEKQRQEYEEKYRDALKYFTSIQDNPGEFRVLTEIGKLHAYLGNEDGLRSAIKEFEKLQDNAEIVEQAQYWRVLSDFYSYVGEQKKSKNAEDKAESLGG